MICHARTKDISQHLLCAAGTPKDNVWYTRDVMWKETSRFGIETLVDLSGEQYLECLQSVHLFEQQHGYQRLQRRIVAGKGPIHVSDHGPALEDDVGEELLAFKLSGARVFQ